MAMTDSNYALDLIKKLADTVEEYCVIHEGLDHLGPLVAEARAYLKSFGPPYQISEEENEVRFKECLRAINNLKPGDITELMGEAFMEEFRRVSK
jgi:hypothetical protein